MWTAVVIGLNGADMLSSIKINELCQTLCKYLLVFVFGFVCCYIFFPRTLKVVEYHDRVVHGEANSITQTELVYTPKTDIVSGSGTIGTEKTDVDIRLPKQELHVSINGQNAVIEKASDESYLFEKNKLQLEQKSSAQLNISIPTIDNTRHWAVGIGYGSNGLAGVLDFPLYKQHIDGWLYVDQRVKTVGLKIRF